MANPILTRRKFLAASATAAVGGAAVLSSAEPAKRARIAITLDLEMSAQYPQRSQTEWNYRKGDLDEATKRYAVEAARLVKERGNVLHFFAVGATLEQPDVGWLKEIAAAGHPVGNHTYDHVNVLATRPEQIQFRFQRAPWLIRNRAVADVIADNIRLTTTALKDRCGITPAGFRTPGGFTNGLADRPDIQKMLLDQGFTWVSSKYPNHQTGPAKKEPTEAVYADIVRAQADAQPFAYPSGLIEVPMSPISDVGAFRTNYWKLGWFLEALKRSMTWAIANGAVFDFLAHPSCLVVEDPRFESIKLMCDMVKDAGDRAGIVDLGSIARGVAKK